MFEGAFVAFPLLVGGYINLAETEPVKGVSLTGYFALIERWRRQLLSHGRLGGMKADNAKGDERGTKECH